MRAGWLRRRVDLQNRIPVQNGFGEEVLSWVTDATVWASVEPLRGQEYAAAQTEQQAVTHRIRIRYRDGVTPDMRVQHTNRAGGTQTFDIESVVEPATTGRYLELMCREII